jgi:hypothetical protein
LDNEKVRESLKGGGWRKRKIEDGLKREEIGEREYRKRA